MSNRFLFVVALVTAFLGCGGEPLGVSSEALSSVDNHGTRLTASVDPETSCQDVETAKLMVSGTLESSASGAPVTVALYVDGVLAVAGLERPDWDRDTRFKRAPFSRTTLVANGAHVVEVCVDQPGAIGRTPKGFCTQPIEVDVMCAGLCGRAGLSELTDGWYTVCR